MVSFWILVSLMGGTLVPLLVLVACVGGGAAARQARVRGTHLELRPLYVRRCDVPQSLQWMDVQYSMSGRTNVHLDIKAILNYTASTYTKMKIDVTRCKDFVSPGTCVPLPNFVRAGTSSCSIIMAPMMPWSDLVSKLRPRAQCPLKAGNYTANDVHLNFVGSDMVIGGKSIYLDGYIWDAQWMMFEFEKIVVCFDTRVEVVRVRDKA